MKAIILAAGNGKRLYPYTKNIPKCLLNVGGKTILENQIDHIKSCGIDEVVIVVGYRSAEIEHFLRDYDGLGMRIKTLYNPFYKTTNSLISLWIAKGEMTQDIVVMNGDDVFESDVLEQVLSESVKDQQIYLAVKTKTYYEEEDMKVVIKGNNIIEIGKSLTNGTSAESTGIRVFRDRGVELMKRAIEEEIRTEGAMGKWYVSAIDRLINKGYKVKPLDINDLFWMDVDYPSDLSKANFLSNKFIKTKYAEKTLRAV